SLYDRKVVVGGRVKCGAGMGVDLNFHAETRLIEGAPEPREPPRSNFHPAGMPRVLGMKHVGDSSGVVPGARPENHALLAPAAAPAEQLEALRQHGSPDTESH